MSQSKQSKASDAPERQAAADTKRGEAEARAMHELALARQKEEAEDSKAVMEELAQREEKTREMLANAKKQRAAAPNREG